MGSTIKQLPPFLSAVARNPAGVGAAAPTSSAVAHRLAAVVPGFGDPMVLELGPGTGPVSAQVQRRLAGRGRHVAVERDRGLAGHLTRQQPGVEVVVGDASELERLLAAQGLAASGIADAVVSGLPWSLLRVGEQRNILEAAARALRPGAAFTTIAYRHALRSGGARHFAALLDEVFDEVLITQTVWRNLPPAATYVCRRPR